MAFPFTSASIIHALQNLSNEQNKGTRELLLKAGLKEILKWFSLAARNIIENKIKLPKQTMRFLDKNKNEVKKLADPMIDNETKRKIILKPGGGGFLGGTIIRSLLRWNGTKTLSVKNKMKNKMKNKTRNSKNKKIKRKKQKSKSPRFSPMSSMSTNPISGNSFQTISPFHTPHLSSFGSPQLSSTPNSIRSPQLPFTPTSRKYVSSLTPTSFPSNFGSFERKSNKKKKYPKTASVENWIKNVKKATNVREKLHKEYINLNDSIARFSPLRSPSAKEVVKRKLFQNNKEIEQLKKWAFKNSELRPKIKKLFAV